MINFETFEIITLSLGIVVMVIDIVIRIMQKRSERSKNTKMTIGDRIRSMSDVELANFLVSDQTIACLHCKDSKDGKKASCPCSKGHEASVMCEWLSSESEAMRF